MFYADARFSMGKESQLSVVVGLIYKYSLDSLIENILKKVWWVFLSTASMYIHM